MKIVRNQKGITLIELLATLVISTIIIGLATQVLISTFTRADVTTDHANLRQEANIVLTKIRSDYTVVDTPLILNFNETDEMLNNENGSPLAEENRYRFTAFEIIEKRPTGDLVREFTYEEGSPPDPLNIIFEKEQQNSANRLYVNFTLTDKNDRSFEVDTMISRLGDYEDYTGTDNGPDNQNNDVYNYFASNNFYLYSSDMDFNGRTIINGEEGAVYFKEGLDLSDDSSEIKTEKLISIEDLDLSGDNTRIESQIIFTQGDLDVSGDNACIESQTIIVKGDFDVSGKNACIESQTIIVKGDFDVSDDAEVTINNKIFVNGDFDLNDGSTNLIILEGGRIYITEGSDYDSSETITDYITKDKFYEEYESLYDSLADSMYPIFPEPIEYSLQDDNWFNENGYITIDENDEILKSNRKYFASEDLELNFNTNIENLIVVSKGDIEISFGDKTLNAFLAAPNGEVILDGKKFEGIIISSEGVELKKENMEIEYLSYNNFFNHSRNFPLQ